MYSYEMCSLIKRMNCGSLLLIFVIIVDKGSKCVFHAPQCLMSNGLDGRMEIDENVLQQVAALAKELVVVAIAGQYRTGKSYLMNRLAGQKLGKSFCYRLHNK